MSRYKNLNQEVAEILRKTENNIKFLTSYVNELEAQRGGKGVDEEAFVEMVTETLGRVREADWHLGGEIALGDGENLHTDV